MNNTSHFYARRIHALYGFRKASYFLLQTKLRPKLFTRWFDLVEATLPADTPETDKVRLAMRPAFRFINPRFTAAQRIAVLTHHFTVMKEKFPRAATRDRMRNNANNKLAEIKGKSGKTYSFATRQEISKEGVIRIVFIDDAAGFALAHLAGVFALDKGKPVFYVGMLRGPGQKILDNREMIVKTTKDLNGLRPKQAVFHAAAALAAWFGAEEIIAPRSDEEIAMKNLLKGHKVLANHDSFWQEFAPESDADGIYHMPLPLPRRNIEDVQQKRRKDWRARYAHIDDFSTQIKNTLDTLSQEKGGDVFQTS